MYKQIIRPILFRQDPEKIHNMICRVLKLPMVKGVLHVFYAINLPSVSKKIGGLHFDNPVGLAAGFDKNGELVNEMAALGFGFVEIGTVTPVAQAGNDKPRLFRLPLDHALINRMGFNNDGVEKVRRNLLKRRRKCLVGGNIGKNKFTPNDRAVDDYLLCFKRLYDVVDYFVVNVSSPNTPGLRELQDADALVKILTALQEENRLQAEMRPIFLKIAPDLTHGQLDDIIRVVKETGITGIIATNTTISRKNLRTRQERIDAIGAGGLSGEPLKKKATEVIRYLAEKSDHAFPIIAAGGIHSPADALDKIAAGASLIQIYTGFIYEGPGLIRKIVRKLSHR
ncbi:MAG: quinone-dependent dihydroorotate dehydrogenase [Calditrichales bacterium]|nr:MAG: quinone-dependent dihydroorotate dehydrogenase [Calditrichales bacterium]